jgi:hypothetical protein
VRETHAHPSADGFSRRDLTPKIVARFQAKFIKSDTCWLWRGARTPKGYGLFAVGRQNANGQSVPEYAHRVAYLREHSGSIPSGRVVMHACDVRNCVNPAHLRLGTQSENVQDGIAKGRYHYPGPTTRKLTDQAVCAIRAEIGTLDAIAARHGVSRTHVSMIRRNLRRQSVQQQAVR